MMEEIKIPIHKQILQSNIYKKYMKHDAKWNLLHLDNDTSYIYFLEYVLEYLIDERGYEIDNYISHKSYFILIVIIPCWSMVDRLVDYKILKQPKKSLQQYICEYCVKKWTKGGYT